MEVFVVVNGKREGPLSLYQLREMLVEGAVTGATIGWMRGQEKWVPLRELPPALGVIQELEQERLDLELENRGRPEVPPVPEIPYQRLASHGFARYGARMIDLLLANLILVFLISLPEVPAGFRWPETYSELWAYFQKALLGEYTKEEKTYLETVALIQAGALPVLWVLEACLLTWFGVTPGKLLFRLRVERQEGSRPGFFRALMRSVLVFWLGMGATIPGLNLLFNVLAFMRLQNRGTALWDDWMCTVVRQQSISGARFALILLVFVSLAMGAVLLSGR